jgi:hypothetical protein
MDFGKRKKYLGIILICFFVILIVIIGITLGFVYGFKSKYVYSSNQHSICSSDPVPFPIALSTCSNYGEIIIMYVSPQLFCTGSIPVIVPYYFDYCINQVILNFPLFSALILPGCSSTTSFTALGTIPLDLVPLTLQSNPIEMIVCGNTQTGTITIDTSGIITILSTPGSSSFNVTTGCVIEYNPFTITYNI